MVSSILKLSHSQIISDKAAQNSHQSKTVTCIDVIK